MATPVSEVVKVNWNQVFPWVALFRTLGLTLHVRQVFVGIIAAGLIALGQSLMLGSPFPRAGIFLSSFFPAEFFGSAWTPLVDQLWPLEVRHALAARAESGVILFSAPTVWQLALLLITMAWGLIVGSLAGGILVRRTAFEFAREESLSLTAATRFVGQRVWDYLTAPALPLSAALGLGFLLILAGWTARWLPGGGYLVSAAWCVVYLCGIAMAILLLAVLAAWPMMIAAVSINGGDGFDALSRGFGFVLDRWRYYAWCVLVMSLYGGVCVILIWVAKQCGEVLILSSFQQGAGLTSTELHPLPQLLPIGGWDICLSLIGSGLAYSFFWSNMTVIYLVLRKSVDNANMDDIYVEGATQGSDELQALLNPQVPAAEPTLLPIIDPPA